MLMLGRLLLDMTVILHKLPEDTLPVNCGYYALYVQ